MGNRFRMKSRFAPVSEAIFTLSDRRCAGHSPCRSGAQSPRSAGLSRRSSVPALKLKPNMPIRLCPVFMIRSMPRAYLYFIAGKDRTRESVFPDHVSGLICQSTQIFGQARTAKGEAGPQSTHRKYSAFGPGRRCPSPDGTSTPNALLRLPISLANPIFNACQLLSMYLTISEISSSVLMRGASSREYRPANGFPAAGIKLPNHGLGGALKSLTAEPSRRNSGLWQTPKPLPATFPEASSRIGITMLRTVPGKTVLRIATTCQSFFASGRRRSAHTRAGCIADRDSRSAGWGCRHR